MSSEPFPLNLLAGEKLLDDDEERLWRQIHPLFIDQGRITSQAFLPTDKDRGQLSVTRGSLLTARESFEHYTRVTKLASRAVYAVTVREAREEQLPVIDDSEAIEHPSDTPGHAYIDFRPQLPEGNRKIRKVAKRLRDAAQERGCQYSDHTGEQARQ